MSTSNPPSRRGPEDRMPQQVSRWINTWAAVGTAAGIVATTISYLQVTGGLPAWLTVDGQNMWASYQRIYGVPVEFIAVVWFVSVLFVYKRPLARDTGLHFLTYLSGSAVAGSALALSYYIGGMPVATIAITTAAVAIIVIASSLDVGAFRTLPRRLATDVRKCPTHRMAFAQLTLLCTSASLLAVFLSLAATNADTAATDVQFQRWYRSLPVSNEPTLHVAGGVRIIFFADYPCAICDLLVPRYRAIERMYNAGRIGRVQFAVRPFPMSTQCNEASQQTHPYACEAAAAVELVKTMVSDDASQDMAHTLYGTSSLNLRTVVAAELRRFNLLESFQADFVTSLKRLRAEAKRAARAGVLQAPSLFVNGRKVRLLSQDELISVVDAELSRDSSAN